MFAHGDVDDYFSIQSTSKPVTYGMALAERGEDFVHSYVGGPARCQTPPTLLLLQHSSRLVVTIARLLLAHRDTHAVDAGRWTT